MFKNKIKKDIVVTVSGEEGRNSATDIRVSIQPQSSLGERVLRLDATLLSGELDQQSPPLPCTRMSVRLGVHVCLGLKRSQGGGLLVRGAPLLGGRP